MITKLIALLLLFPTAVYWYQVDYFHGVKVNNIKNLCWDSWGCYFYRWPFNKQININKSYWQEKYTQIVRHEYWHHIWYSMTLQEQLIWKRTWNCFVSDYAKTNNTEDFAEIMRYYLSNINTDCKLKTLVAEYFYNKYKRL